MMADILLTNAPAVLRALGEAQAELNALAALIEDGDPERLLDALCRVQGYRREWERSRET
jgi:prephenate dehydrogenase